MMSFRPNLTLDYLFRKPKKIIWKVLAGEGLHPIQMYDLIFDDYDLKIRQLKK